MGLRRAIRALVITFGLATAVALFALGLVFGLNGGQWAWWRDASWVAVVPALGLSLSGALGVRGRVRRPRLVHVLGMFGGSIAVAVSVVVMARHYSDPYGGPLLWPHVLACVALSGLVVAIGSAALALADVPRRR
jgi:hypothetical protein